MNEWNVVTVIIALVGLGAAVMKPMLTLNTSIVKLTARMENVSQGLDDLNDKNTENHKRIWDRMDEHGDQLKDHEKRIDHLENMEIERSRTL